MNIIQIIPTLSAGGAERITVDICNKLSEKHNVYLVQLTSNSQSSFYKNQLFDQVNYFNLNGKVGKLFDFKVLFKLIKFIDNLKPEIIHGHLNISYLFFLSILFKSISFFYTIHNVADKECLIIKGISFRRLSKLYFLKKIISPITISPESQKSFQDFYKINSSVLIENGCYPKEKTKLYSEVKMEVSNLRTNNKDVLFLTVGRFAPQKNHEMLVTVFNRLITEGLKVKLLIIGHGFDDSKGLELQNKAVKGIYFLGPKENVSDYLFVCDAFCLSSLWEGLPITILEALSSGCVPICTPAGGVPNVILNESLGFISKNYSHDEYYLTIKDYLSKRKMIDRSILIEYFFE